MSSQSFIKTFRQVCTEIELNCFDREDIGFAKEICLIIAEVISLPDDYTVKIAGELMPAELIKEVYRLITHEHVKLVMENFKELNYIIKHKKAYLRTALYNVVFEMEGHWLNQLGIDLSVGGADSI